MPSPTAIPEARRQELLRYAQEILYCERILAKTGDTVLTATLAHIEQPTFWSHYPEGDVFDADTGAQWYYHSHGDTPALTGGNGQATGHHAHARRADEHGHFHCFICPEGKPGPIHHLVAVSVDALGKLQGFFVVARHVVNDDAMPVERRIQLLERFDVQLGRPDYLVNRWLTAMLGLYHDEIATLIRQGEGRATQDARLDVTAELITRFPEKASALGLECDLA